jgi:hypothetical protein
MQSGLDTTARRSARLEVYNNEIVGQRVTLYPGNSPSSKAIGANHLKALLGFPCRLFDGCCVVMTVNQSITLTFQRLICTCPPCMPSALPP